MNGEAVTVVLRVHAVQEVVVNLRGGGRGGQKTKTKKSMTGKDANHPIIYYILRSILLIIAPILLSTEVHTK